MEHVRTALRRGLSRAQRRSLAPLEPNAFLAWAWQQGDRAKGTTPLTVDDVWFELARHDADLARETVRRDYLRLAARFRRDQRLGLDPWDGVVR